MKQTAKGFTLLELLIVIGILSILAAVVVLVLNPAELLRQARDSQRISDLSTLKSAFGLYLSSVQSPSLGSACFTQCYVNIDGLATGCTKTDGTARHGTTGAPKAPIYDADRTIDGSGWIPVNLTTIPGGAPLSVLPRDPINSITLANDYFYSYACDSTELTFELNANMESIRYRNGGQDDVESTDGGYLGDGTTPNNDIYEVGTDPLLNL